MDILGGFDEGVGRHGHELMTMAISTMSVISMGLNSNWPFHWRTGHPPSGRHRVTWESTLEAAHLLPL